VKRRIGLVGAALSVCLVASVAGTATAASTSLTKVKCSTSTSISIASGDTGVSPPVSQGSEYGTASCGKLLGGGVQKDRFTVPTSGDTVAKYALFFGAGTLRGTYDLTPTQPSALNFLETDWTGTLKVLAGTGAYKGLTGTGTMVCKTLDGIHTACTDTLKLKMG
jgi:hypothetical protein